MSSKKKLRAEFRKKHESRTRERGLTKAYEAHELEEDAIQSERVSGKGELTRKRTIIGASAEETETGHAVRLDVDEAQCQRGRVLSVHGLTSEVEAEDGTVYHCATRRLLKTLSTDQRTVVAAGDRVFFRLTDQSADGIIERVEPRHGVLARTSKGRQHVIVTNVDQLLIVTSAAEPNLKPNLIDRFLLTAEKNGIRPLIVINKVDLVPLAELQPLAGVFGQMGYQVLMVSARTGFGVERLHELATGRESVIAGQSGVGKSSILNAIDPGLQLRVREVSTENQKGKHTTTSARLIRLSKGGYIVDTPGIRQFQLWDVEPEEVAGFYRDLRPFVNLCRFPDCTHIHEADCGVKNAVADGRLDARRYDSYCHLFRGDDA